MSASPEHGAAAVPANIPFRSSIRLRLVLLVLAIGVPFLVYVGLSAARQTAAERDEASERMVSLARLVAARTDDYLSDMEDAIALASHGVVVDPAATAGNDAFLQSLRSDLPKSMNNMGVWSLDGRNVGTLDRARRGNSLNIAARQFFRDAINRRQLAIAGPLPSPVGGEPVAVFARPLLDVDGRPRGVVTASTRLRELTWLLDAKGAAPAAAIVTLVDAAGTILARNRDSQAWIGKELPGVGSVAGEPELHESALERPGADGVQHLVAYASTARAPWRVFVETPADAVLSSSRMTVAETLLAGLSALILGVAFAFYSGTRIARPLRQLAVDALRLGQGDLTHRTAVAGRDETGVLGATLNRMAVTLEERSVALEDKRAELARSAANLELIAANVPALIAQLTIDERFLFVNARSHELFGLPPEALVGRHVADFLSPEAYALTHPYMQRVKAGERTRFQRSVLRDGREYHELVDYIPDRDADGRVVGIFALVQDVSDLHAAQAQVEESEKRLRGITDNIPLLVGYIDRNRRYRFNSRYYESWLGRPLAEITGHPVAEVLGPQAWTTVGPNLDRAFAGERVEFDIEVKDASGSRHLRGNYVPDFDASGDVVGVYTSSNDVTPLKETERALERLAQYDTLTGLPNRHRFNDGIAAALQRSERSGTSVALLFLDIDGFKGINDALGHAGGDEVLREFARRISASVRATDLVARLAGDEFVIVLEGIHRREESRFVARKIIAAMRSEFHAGETSLRVTTSIGIALGQGAAATPESLLKRADSALYAAKRQGRDRYEIAI